MRNLGEPKLPCLSKARMKQRSEEEPSLLSAAIDQFSDTEQAAVIQTIKAEYLAAPSLPVSISFSQTLSLLSIRSILAARLS